jgi:PPOX class probable F420-dependent enzyme
MTDDDDGGFMGTPIGGWAREMLERVNSFGTLATINADGTPHQAVVWYLVRGDSLVVNSAVGRIWPANLRRDPRCSLLVEDGYDWVSIQGSVEVVSDQPTAQADIAAMARKYKADDPEAAERMIREVFEPQERITFVLRPARIVEHPDE